MAGWLDNLIIGIIVILGLFIMYKALKEPIDLVGGLIKKGVMGIKNALSDKDLTGGYEEIRYG